jgi:predicted flap endonuclease-1-like 5' DNA nuclease
MSITRLLTGIFLLFFCITLIFPNLPPGASITLFLHQVGLPAFPNFVSWISFDWLLNSTLNGVLWTSALFALHFGIQRVLQRQAHVSSAHFIALPHSKSTRIGTRARSSHKITKTNRSVYTYVSLEQDIELIEGIGPIYGHRLRGNGVVSVGDLLQKGATPIGRRELANRVEVSTNIIQKWVNQADFFRLRGVGTQYADLITSTGVETVIDLSTRSSKDLYQQLRTINLNKNLVRRTPPYRTLQRWIHQAKRLTPIIKH